MTVFGLTGGTGTGKTTALNAIRDLGGLVIDCDEVYHGLTQTSAEMLSGIEARFPGTVVNGVLQRKALGAVVFSDEAALKDLNAITHGFVCRKVERLRRDACRHRRRGPDRERARTPVRLHRRRDRAGGGAGGEDHGAGRDRS